MRLAHRQALAARLELHRHAPSEVDPVEFAALDSGAIDGWKRTGFAFNAYVSASVPVRTIPVCRLYGSPAAGLDTHFFSADPAECEALAGSGNGPWLLESPGAFRVVRADAASGACGTGTTPVYRLWNRRADAGHRYTASRAERDAMVAAGYVAEGHGPDPVAWCAPVP